MLTLTQTQPKLRKLLKKEVTKYCIVYGYAWPDAIKKKGQFVIQT